MPPKYWIVSLATLLMIVLTTPAAAQWQNVDCGAAKLNAPNQIKCQHGPIVNNSGGTGLNTCAIEEWNVSTRSPESVGYARMSIMQTLAPKCGAGQTIRSDVAGSMRRSQSVAEGGTAWSAVSQIGDLSYASFTSAQGENCKAFLKLGPPWQSAFIWFGRGWLCGTSGKTVSDADLQTYVSGLVIKTP
jgi:hypothetical protein